MEQHDDGFELDASEQRALGCLIEKEATVPDTYPLTLNSLRSACNQSTSRNPVVDYDDATIETALDSLRHRGLIRVVHSRSNRAIKYRHVADDVYGFEAGELALVCVLLLRGPQTVGELKSRTARQHGFDGTDEVEAALQSLAVRQPPLVQRLDRRAGQKDVRWEHLLGDVDHDVAHGTIAEPSPAPTASPAPPTLQVNQTCADVDDECELQVAVNGLQILADERPSGMREVTLGLPGSDWRLRLVEGEPERITLGFPDRHHGR